MTWDPAVQHAVSLVKRPRGPLDPHWDARCPDCGYLARGVDLDEAKRAKRKHLQDVARAAAIA